MQADVQVILEELMTNQADRPQGMRASELNVICSLIQSRNYRRLLEVGMANGSSSVAMLKAANVNGHATLTSIDPYQLLPQSSVRNANNDGYSGEGVRNVRDAGFSEAHALMAEPNYTALPKLVERGEKFDFIFIDGYHSFDYAFLDFFYADLLLRVGGVVAFHDSSYPAVYKVCRFVVRNKKYQPIGPRPEPMYPDFTRKIIRRLRYWLSGESQMLRERRLVWCSVAAFEKLGDLQCPPTTVVDF